MTAAAPAIPALEFIRADAEPTDAFVDSLIDVLWDEAERRLTEQAAPGRASDEDTEVKE